MKAFVRRIRGIFGTGFSWAISWGVGGLGMHLVALAAGWPGWLGGSFLEDALGFALMGLVGGGVFSTGFLLTEGRRQLQDLSPGRGGFWGALAGLSGPVLSLLFGAGWPWDMILAGWPLLVSVCLFGGGTGAFMTSLAKRETDQALPEGPTKGKAALER